ncbi:MAG: Adenylyl cyclase class-3/4/guanylyl cyclase [uncultured bacterium]|nr:MAG: Adenylyl cyclase class-3/4/guanylyl cyclase [uncultured bacterium]
MKENALQRFGKLLDAVINQNLEKGSRIAATFGLLSATVIFTLDHLGITRDFLIPGLWAFLCGVFCLIVYGLARNGRVKGRMRLLVFLGFISAPTLIYVIAFFMLPAGTATYMTGPPSYLYFFMIILTGLLFDPVISVVAGIVAGLEYFTVFLLGHQFLLLVQCPDPLMYQDLTSVPIYAFKALLMAFSGLLMGVLSRSTIQLISQILAEEHEKENLDRLFGQFVSTEVKNRIIAEKRGVVGEKRELVVLFSDIRSYSTISEKNTPEKMVQQLNRYFDRMIEVINRENGVIDKFIGDAIMATFDGVVPVENPCAAAVKAAISMQHELIRLNTDYENEGLSPFKTGIGIHFGEVIMGTIGCEHRKEFTVIGDTVNIASRIESTTKEHQCYIMFSDAVFRALPADLQALATPIGDIALKGKEIKVALYGIRTLPQTILTQPGDSTVAQGAPCQTGNLASFRNKSNGKSET